MTPLRTLELAHVLLYNRFRNACTANCFEPKCLARRLVLLVRYHDYERVYTAISDVSPSSFIPLESSFAFINKISHWYLDLLADWAACDLYKAQELHGTFLKVIQQSPCDAIDVSPTSVFFNLFAGRDLPQMFLLLVEPMQWCKCLSYFL